jgi:predicted MFS family arabinose efflux permease
METKSPLAGEEQSSTTTLESGQREILPTVEKEMKPKSEKKSLAFMLAFASIMASNFISIMDTVIVATALPAIAHGLNAKSNEAYWLGSGFLFAQAVSQPLYGTMSSVFGRKPCFVFSMALFTIASVFCATAQSVAWLIVARVVCSMNSTLKASHALMRNLFVVPRSWIRRNTCRRLHHSDRHGISS